MMKAGLTGSSFSVVQEPQALVVAPTRELATQIYMDARKFAHGTMLRPVVLYGGTSVGYQLRQVEQGTHILVGTPGRLIDIFGKGKVSVMCVYQGSHRLEKYLNIQDCLEKSLKIKIALKRTGKRLKGLEKPLNFTIYRSI